MRTLFNVSDEERHWCPRDLTILVEAADGEWFCPKLGCEYVITPEEPPLEFVA